MIESIDIFRSRVLKSYVGYNGAIRLDPSNHLHPCSWYFQLNDPDIMELYYFARDGRNLCIRVVSILRKRTGLFIVDALAEPDRHPEAVRERKIAQMSLETVEDEIGEFGYGGDWWKES